MKQYTSEMTRAFNQSGQITNSFNFASIYHLPTLPTLLKSIYGEPVVEEEKENNFLVKGLKVTGNSIKGAGIGLFDVGKDTVVGLYDTVTDPKGTVESLYHSVTNPFETYKYIEKAIVDSYERDKVNGYAESRSHWVSYALGTTATAVVGTKGAGALTKTGVATTKTAVQKSVTIVPNAMNTMQSSRFAQILPYGPHRQVEMPGGVAFNVINGPVLKESLNMQAKKLPDSGVGLNGPVRGSGKYQVGAYKDIKGVEGLDAHHAGQKALMKNFVESYDLKIAPAINVPKVGHTRRGPNGIVSRSTEGIDSPRQLLARDIKELRRVYDDIPNSTLKELIELNKKMYPEMRK